MPAPALSSEDVSEIIGAAFDVHNHLVQTYKLPFASYDSHDEFKTNIEHLDYSDWAKNLKTKTPFSGTEDFGALAPYMAYVVHTHVQDTNGNAIDLGITIAAMWQVLFNQQDAQGFLSLQKDKIGNFVKNAAAVWSYDPKNTPPKTPYTKSVQESATEFGTLVTDKSPDVQRVLFPSTPTPTPPSSPKPKPSSASGGGGGGGGLGILVVVGLLGLVLASGRFRA